MATDEALELLGKRYLEREGVDLRFQEVTFLEPSELGDAASLRQRFSDTDEIERRSFVASVDQQGRSGLLLAVAKGDAELVDVLLEHSANPNHADCSGATALHYAAGRGASSIVAALLSACANVGVKDDQGEQALMWAAAAPTVIVLLGARADPLARSAVRGGVEPGCVAAGGGRTALMCAAVRGDVNVVEALACACVSACSSSAACLDETDAAGRSALALADAAGHHEVVVLLSKLGAKTVTPEARANVLLSVPAALLDAARRGDSDACSDLLTRRGISVDEEIGGETPLLCAVSSGSLAATAVLLDARADANLGDSFLGETPLLRALMGGASDELLWLLLEARADASKGDLSCRTPVEIATSWGREDAAEILRAAVAGELPLGDG